MEHIQIDTAAFAQEVDGKQVGLYFLKNKNGLEMAVTNFGAKVVALAVPDKNGNFEDIVLGYDNLDGYPNSGEKYFGAAIGRYGNRIAGGRSEEHTSELQSLMRSSSSVFCLKK